MSAHSIFTVLDAVGYEAGRLLLTLLWQSSIVFPAAWVLLRLLRSARAAVRFGILITAVLTVPILPAVTWLSAALETPRHELTVIPGYTPPSDPAIPGNGVSESEVMGSVQSIESMSDNTALSGTTSTKGTAGLHNSSMSAQETESSAEVADPFSLLDYPWAIALLLYSMITNWLLLWFAAGRIRLGSWIMNGRPVIDERVLHGINEARSHLDISRPVTAIECDHISAPLTYRANRPIIMFPPAFTSHLSDEELRAVIVHECAHIKRRDALLLTFAALIRSLFFVQPLLWIATRQASMLSERACDEIVVDNALDAAPYAELLARIASRVPNHQTAIELAAGFIISRDTFFKRVEAILIYGSHRFKSLPKWAAVMTVLAGMLAVFGAVALPLGERGESGVQRAEDSYTLQGIVLHEGKPIPDALIYINQNRYHSDISDEFKVLDTTDDKGCFSITLPKNDVLSEIIYKSRSLVVFHPHYSIVNETITASAIASGIRIFLT